MLHQPCWMFLQIWHSCRTQWGKQNYQISTCNYLSFPSYKHLKFGPKWPFYIRRLYLEVNGHAKMIDNLTYRCVNIIKIGTSKFWMVKNPKIQLKIPKSKPKCLNFEVQVKNIKIFALNLDPKCIQNNFCCLTWFSLKLCENIVLGCGYYMCKNELAISCR